MLIRELVDTLMVMDPDRDVFVALFNIDGETDIYDIDNVTDNHGDAQINIRDRVR